MTYSKRSRYTGPVMAVLLLIAGLSLSTPSQAGPKAFSPPLGPKRVPAESGVPAHLAPTPRGDPSAPARPSAFGPVVRTSLHNDTSPPLRDMPVIPPTAYASAPDIPPLPYLDVEGGSGERGPVQDWNGTTLMPLPIENWESIPNVNNVYPPDTQGDAGPNHYVQWVNLSFAVYDKGGTLLYGPVNGNTLWQGFGGVCESYNNGDPITLYDARADRWLMSQLALDPGNYTQCIAISASGDPLGSWHRYAFLYSTTKVNDYPKFGIWLDGYYMTARQRDPTSWAGVGVVAYERDEMLQGNPARSIYFDLGAVNTKFLALLPAHMVGHLPPPPGTPNYLLDVEDNAWYPPDDALYLWEFHVDWNNPLSSTFGLGGQPNAKLDIDPWDMLPCEFASRDCIPQPDTAEKLDGQSDRLMYRLIYRNFFTHESLVVNHTILADGADRAGIRWYEVRDPGGTPVVYQQGTFAPADGLYRWMGSIAQDARGNIAVGYSVSSSFYYPSIRYVGRLSSDPPGTLPQGEAHIVEGRGSQTGTDSRWGDYSTMSVDPVDDCTFWYTQEYVETTGPRSWQTRIASFKFPDCQPLDLAWIDGHVYDALTLEPISGTNVTGQRAAGGQAQALTNPAGAYTMTVLPGTFTLTAEHPLYTSDTVSNVVVTPATVTTVDLYLFPQAQGRLLGTVTAAADGAPLQATVTADNGAATQTDPSTGYYEMPLDGGTYVVTATAAGYRSQSACVTITAGADTRHDFALEGPPLAAFSADPEAGCPSLRVSFTDESLAAPPINRWLWAFGDGVTSTQQHPVYTYTTPGVYGVRLTVSNTLGSDIVSSTITAHPLPLASFSYAPASGTLPLTVYLTDTSSAAISPTWDFGDGSPAETGDVVSHTYAASGRFTATLFVDSPHGCGQAAAAGVVSVSAGCTPVQIVTHSAHMTGCVVGLAAGVTGTAPFGWLWAFGDGVTSTAATPVYTYSAGGPYTVTVHAWNCLAQGHAVRSFRIDVACVESYNIYLPIVFKQEG